MAQTHRHDVATGTWRRVSEYDPLPVTLAASATTAGPGSSPFGVLVREQEAYAPEGEPADATVAAGAKAITVYVREGTAEIGEVEFEGPFTWSEAADPGSFLPELPIEVAVSADVVVLVHRFGSYAAWNDGSPALWSDGSPVNWN